MYLLFEKNKIFSDTDARFADIADKDTIKEITFNGQRLKLVRKGKLVDLLDEGDVVWDNDSRRYVFTNGRLVNAGGSVVTLKDSHIARIYKNAPTLVYVGNERK